MSTPYGPSESGLPTYLSTPPQSRVAPPAQTRHQELPFGNLAWEDFERLCLRLVRRDADVIHSQLYGTRGQDQEGIDFYARLDGDGEFRVYQCKRENAFGPAKIRKAVDRFLEGKWSETAKMLVLCTTDSLVASERADEVEEQRNRLRDVGVGFDTWDRDALSERLKIHSDLIDDFFGRPWVEAYLGREAADRLGTRLDAIDVAEFRSKLGDLYRNAFASHDPGLPLGGVDGSDALDLRDRYVIPDVLVKVEVVSSNSPVGAERDEPTAVLGRESQQAFLSEPQSIRRHDESSQTRLPAGTWLSSGTNLLLIGGPGSGKSSLLRYLATDLLTAKPLLAGAAARWAGHLPVWVSFPLWTQLVEREQADVCSLGHVLRAWLRAWEEERLWPLVERALCDDRLLLLVDGLDEWTNESAARVALQRLQVFVAQRRIPSVAATRPHGLIQLGMRLVGWESATLAGLSVEQQRSLALIWFSHREARAKSLSIEPSTAGRRADLVTETFISDLCTAPDLGILAQNPLLLSLLIFHRVHHFSLPQTRFHAYESLIEHLLAAHPRQRRAAAGIGVPSQEELKDVDLKQVLGALAYRVHVSSGPGLILDEEATKCVERFLRDDEEGFGINAIDARRLARWVTNIGETNLGLLVRQSPNELGFLHRSFQEFLASYHLSRQPIEKQKEVVRRYAAAPPWREVTLGLLHCSGRTADVDALVTEIRGLRDTSAPAERLPLEALLAEAAFGEYKCSPRVAREVAVESFDVIETGSRMGHREVLLGHALGGLSSVRTREQVRERLYHWFPCVSRFRGNTLLAMGDWPKEPETVRTLLVALFDEEVSIKFAAAQALAKIGSGDVNLGMRIRKLALTSEDALTRSAAIECLLVGWPTSEGIEMVVSQACHGDHPALRFTAIRARITVGLHTLLDRDELIRLANLDSSLYYVLRPRIPELLLKGWPNDSTVKASALDVLTRRTGIRGDSSVAWDVLLRGYPGDDEVVDAVVDELKKEHSFLGNYKHDGPWDVLAANFANHPKLVLPMKRWIETYEGLENVVAQAALVCRTETSKKHLLASLASTVFPHWPAWALLQGWGMSDPEVAAAFRGILDSGSSSTARIAHLLPRVIPDPAECRATLLDLLRNPDCKRPDFALRGLLTMGDSADQEVVDAVLAGGIDRTDGPWIHREATIEYLIDGCHLDPRVRVLARSALNHEYPPYTTIARRYSDDPEYRDLIRRRMAPLPSRLRLFIARHLSDYSPDPGLTRDVLSLYRSEENESVTCEASLSYHYQVISRGLDADTQGAIDTLAKEIVCYGPRHDLQRQGAFCGLAALRRFDIMASARETIGDPRPAEIGLYAGTFGTNTSLLRVIAGCWEAIRETFGTETIRRLNKGSDDSATLYDQLCPFADESPMLKRDILIHLDGRRGRPMSQNSIAFLARARPKSQSLLDACLDTLHVGDINMDLSDRTYDIVAAVLRDQFAGDNRIIGRIFNSQGVGDIRCQDVIAIAESSPKHYCLDDYYILIKNLSPRPDYPAWQLLACARGTTGEVVSIVQFLCATPRVRFVDYQYSTRPIMLRIERDESVRESLMTLLHSDATPAECASIPRLLALARGADQTLRAWCERELLRQTKELASPEIGFDLVAGVDRCVVQSLLDVVTGASKADGEFEQA